MSISENSCFLRVASKSYPIMLFRSQLLILLIGICLFFVSSACGDCSGCDEIFTTQGAAFRISDTTIDLRDPYAVAEIKVERVVTKRSGTRNCRYKNLVTCMEDELDSNKLEIYCTSDLQLVGGPIPAGTNLLTQKELTISATGPGVDIPTIVLRAGPLFPAGSYTFLLKGLSREGKLLEDIAHIYWN